MHEETIVKTIAPARLSAFVRAIPVVTALALLSAGACATTVKVDTAEAARKALDNAKPGDEILLADKTWPDLKLTLAAHGDSSRPLVIRSDSAGGAILTGQPEIRITGANLEVRDLTLRDCSCSTGSKGLIQFDAASQCRVTSCTFEHSRQGGLPVIALRNTARDNRIDHCQFLDTQYRSIVVVVDERSLSDGPPVRTRIDHNLFQDVPPLGKNGAETIQIGQAALPYSDQRPATVVENNVFVRCDGEIEIISVKTTGNTIRNNVFRDCKGEVVMRHGHDNTAENNVFQGGSGGIRLSGHGHQVTNNVIAGCHGAGIRLYYGTSDTSHPASYLPVYKCRIANNVITNCAEAGIVIGDERDRHYEAQKWAGRPWFASATMDLTVAPRDNIIENNVLTGNAGVLMKVDHAPDNTIRKNVFRATGTASVGESGEAPVISAH